MIKYRFEEEVQYAKYFAEKLNDAEALKIFELGKVQDKTQATYLSEFFWRMVDASIEEENSGTELPWVEGTEFWNEKLMHSISGYLERAGFEQEWDEVSDKQ